MGKIIVFGCLLLVLAILSGCTTGKQVSFEEGYEKIQLMFEEEGVEAPDLSKNIFEDVKELKSLKEVEVPSNAFLEKAGRIKTKLERYKGELDGYAQTEDVKALGEYCDLLIEFFNSSSSLAELVQANGFTRFDEEIRAMEGAGGFEDICDKVEGKQFEAINAVTETTGQFRQQSEKCRVFVENHPGQAEKAKVTGQYCIGLAKLVSLRNILDETMPVLKEACDLTLRMETLQEEGILSDREEMCRNPAKAEEEIGQLVDIMRRYLDIMDRLIEITEKYPEGKTLELDLEKLRDTQKQMELMLPLLEATKPQLEVLCPKQ